MESFISFLFITVIIAICVLITNIENSFLALVLSFAFFILFIVGGIYAVGKALGETSKFKNEIDKEEIND